MSDIDKILDSVRSITITLKEGFSSLSSEIQGTNRRLDDTNQRLDDTNQRLDNTNQRLDNAILELQTFRHETNERLDTTNQRLDETNLELRTFKRETDEHLSGIGTYLKSINGTVLEHNIRIYNLEKRVSKLEGAEGAA